MLEPMSKKKKKKRGQVLTRRAMSICWRPGTLGGGEVSTEVGLKERNDDAEVLSCSQNGLTRIRFD